MSCPQLTPEEVFQRLKEHVALYKTVREAAAALGVSSPYLADVLKGRRDIGPTIATALGVRRVLVYVASDCD